MELTASFIIMCHYSLQDPNYNRINQWLNQTTRSGIVDLFHSTTPHAMRGYYTITAWDEKNQQTTQTFEIDEYGKNQKTVSLFILS